MQRVKPSRIVSAAIFSVTLMLVGTGVASENSFVFIPQAEFSWQRPGHERALRSASTEIGVGVAGWRHGNQWYYVEVQMFLDLLLRGCRVWPQQSTSS